MSQGVAAATLRLATRGSRLARAQTELARSALGRMAGMVIEVVVVQTAGDRDPGPVEQLEGVGWFTTELERALLDGRADAAVHSAKDLPTTLSGGLALAALLERADPRDALVSRHPGGLAGLPREASVATSSPRRAALLHDLRPDLRVVAMRGNVDTRLGKLAAGEVDALLLAAAGLDRLGLGERISERLDPRVFVPAPAQGIIGIEAVSGSTAASLCAPAQHSASAVALRAERSVLRHLGGGCLLPLGAWARPEGDDLILSAALEVAGTVRRGEVWGRPEEAERLGAVLAERLR
ncbi:MAG: hydroxymethylbilane synthase [Candidatus Dormibacteria bacterium]